MTKETVKKLLESSSPEDTTLGAEYSINLSEEDFKSILPESGSGIENGIAYNYKYIRVKSTNTDSSYIDKGKYRILFGGTTLYWIDSPVKDLKSWGWTEKKS